ncbi:MAG: hypothetical protein Q6J68_05840 [Thermostichales cyanobacterium SZTDM-1c_bins_54]
MWKSLLLTCLLAMAVATPVAAGKKLEQQLKTAVEAKDWTQAIAIVDQLISAEPERARQLQAYRRQLLNLAQQANTRDQNSVRTLYSRLNLGLKPETVLSLVGVPAEPQNQKLVEVYQWQFHEKNTLKVIATFDIEFVNGKMSQKSLTSTDPDRFRKRFQKLEPGMTYKRVRSTIADAQTDGKLIRKLETFEYVWNWQSPNGKPNTLQAVFQNQRLVRLVWNYEGRLQEKS